MHVVCDTYGFQHPTKPYHTLQWTKASVNLPDKGWTWEEGCLPVAQSWLISSGADPERVDRVASHPPPTPSSNNEY